MRDVLIGGVMLLVACGNSERGKGGGGEPAPAPVETTPAAMLAEHAHADPDAIARKYRGGVRLSGIVASTDPVRLDAGETSVVELEMGEPLVVRAGDRLTVTCSISSAARALMLARDVNGVNVVLQCHR